jgi:hypothetical protein
MRRPHQLSKRKALNFNNLKIEYQNTWYFVKIRKKFFEVLRNVLSTIPRLVLLEEGGKGVFLVFSELLLTGTMSAAARLANSHACCVSREVRAERRAEVPP